MKKIVSLSALTLFSTAQILGMGGNKRVWSVMDMAQVPAETSPAHALDSGTDPNRFGQLTLSEPNLSDAQAFMKSIKNTENIMSYANYPNTRNRIANAIKCGIYVRSFANIATIKNDLPLWEFLVANRAIIKQKSRIDVTRSVQVKNPPPLFNTLSVQIAALLVEQGQASLSQNIGERGETVIHRACYHDRQPALLEYYLKTYPEGANSTDFQGNTPLFTLCTNGFGTPKSQYLDDVVKKLALLKKAGMSFFYKNKKNESVVAILQNQKPTNPNDATTLTKFSQEHIIGVMEQQRKTRTEEAKKEDCVICLSKLATEGQPLETDPKVKMLDCLHFFHDECISKWYASIPTCPSCRIPVKHNEEEGAQDWDSDADDTSDDPDWEPDDAAPQTTSVRQSALLQPAQNAPQTTSVRQSALLRPAQDTPQATGVRRSERLRKQQDTVTVNQPSNKPAPADPADPDPLATAAKRRQEFLNDLHNIPLNEMDDIKDADFEDAVSTGSHEEDDDEDEEDSDDLESDDSIQSFIEESDDDSLDDDSSNADDDDSSKA